MSMTNKRKKRGRKPFIAVIVLLIIIAAVIGKIIYDYTKHQFLLYNHPIKYENYVEKYANENGIDKYLVYAIIKTESSFNKTAVSEMGARGLMQIMEDSYDWIKYRLSDSESESYDDMFNEETNIRYGTYLITYLFNLFENQTCAISAYHAGSGNVSAWLENEKYSKDGKTLFKIPTTDTAHYVEKIEKAYQNYKNLYGG